MPLVLFIGWFFCFLHFSQWGDGKFYLLLFEYNHYPFQDDFFSVGICSKAGAVSVRRFFVRFCIRSKDIHSFSDSENNRRAASVNFWQSADKPFPASDIFRTFGSDKPILLWR